MASSHHYHLSRWLIAAVVAMPSLVLAQTSGNFAPAPGDSVAAPPPGGSFTAPPPGGTAGQPSGGDFQPAPGGQPGQFNQPGGNQFGPQPDSGQFGQPGGNQFGPPPGGGGQFGPGNGSQFGPGNQGGQQFGPGGEGQQSGPSEADMEKMEQRRMEQEKKMRARGLQQMKRGLTQFSKMLERFKKRVDQLSAQGTPIPADCKENIDKTYALVQSVLTAEDLDPETFDPSELQSAGEVLQECGPKIEQAAQLPRIIKQISAQVTRLEKRHQAMVKRAERSKLDLSEGLTQVGNNIAEFKAQIEGLKTAEDPFAIMEELPEKFQDLEQQLQNLEAVFQFQKVLVNIQRQINRAETMVKRLEKKGEGSEARAILEQIKNLFGEAKQVVKTDPESLPELLGQMDELRGQFEEELNIAKGPAPLFDLKGAPRATPQLNVPKLDQLLLETEILRRYLAGGAERALARYAWLEDHSASTRVAGIKVTAE
ncbi:MAG: hypothetical protein HYV42_04150 [Candidatus Magasanikbacteria bacterium]|nr:hypothetical protein [Candidatus Magasanikbacteria bacterium]